MPKSDCYMPSEGKGIRYKQAPVSVKLPADLQAVVDSFGKRKSDWLRKAIRNQAIKDGLLTSRE